MYSTQLLMKKAYDSFQESKKSYMRWHMDYEFGPLVSFWNTLAEELKYEDADIYT